MSRVIDINADLGEGGQFDRELLTMVSSANISCGAHAGSERDIRQAIEWAIANNVAIGAHPSYPDRENRGRRSLSMTAAELRTSLMWQLHWLETLVYEAGGRLQHIKPHGALYNDAENDPQLAQLLAHCARDFDPSLILVGLAGGKLIAAGKAAGLTVSAEGFTDRRYQANGLLVPRDNKCALITETAEALKQALCFVNGDPIRTIEGSRIIIPADTLCVHGDSGFALEFVRALMSLLSAHDVTVQSRFSKNPA